MPLNPNLRKVLVLGSGPIVIGQARDSGSSATQGCRALEWLGLEVIRVDWKAATTMTDPGFADRTHEEPLSPEKLERILEQEKPDALLPTLGGQRALHLAVALAHSGALERHGVELIGASLAAIEAAADRGRFKHAMERLGLLLPRGGHATAVAEALVLGEQLGYPLVVRSSSTLGETGSGLAMDRRALREAARAGIAASPNGSIQLEECLLGWKQFELEVMRDRLDNVVVVCSLEHFDPMGVHTGDAITVVPAQTLSDRCYQRMRDAALSIIRTISFEAGGCSIQFAVHPDSGEMRVIELNPRISRSSVLAGRATGFPIAKISALLAAGLTLDEIPNDLTHGTPACFEPSLDHCVVKLPHWAFEKLRGADPRPGTPIHSVGEVMAIGRTFPEALLKGWRSLESATGDLLPDPATGGELAALHVSLRQPHADRLRDLFRALAGGMSPEVISRLSGIDPWFLHQMGRIMVVDDALCEAHRHREREPFTDGLVRDAKRLGLSDRQIGMRLGLEEGEVRARRLAALIVPVMKAVDPCGAEFETRTPYFYSTYEEESELPRSSRDKVLVLGSGPGRTGQGLESDYGCMQAALELGSRGFEVLLANFNHGAVGPDDDLSSRVYLEPLTAEDVLDIVDAERPCGVIVPSGGPPPLELARAVNEAGVPLLGPSRRMPISSTSGRPC